MDSDPPEAAGTPRDNEEQPPTKAASQQDQQPPTELSAPAAEGETQSINAWSLEDSGGEVTPYEHRSWKLPVIVAVGVLAAIAVGVGVWALPRLTADRQVGAESTSPPTASISAPSIEGATSKDKSATVEAVGFGRPDGSNYLWATSIVRDVQPGQFVVVSFNLLGPDGKIVVTASQTEQSVNPHAKMIIGTQVTVPGDQDVTRVEASVTNNDYHGPKPKYEEVTLEIGQYSIGEDTFGKPTAEGVIKNPSQQTISDTRVGIACFNDQNSIIGGGSNFPALIPPGGQIKVSQSVMVSQVPTRCEMTAQPSDF